MTECEGLKILCVGFVLLLYKWLFSIFVSNGKVSDDIILPGENMIWQVELYCYLIRFDFQTFVS